jgi:hypothetical protein
MLLCFSVPVTHDPGWNDPPVFSYDDVAARAQAKTPKRGLLNKRVAFPMGSQPSSNVSPTTKSMLPPMPNRTGSAVQLDQPPLTDHPSTASNTTEDNTKDTPQKEEALQRVMEGLECILKNSACNFQVSFLYGLWGF